MVQGLTDEEMKAMVQGKSKGLTDEEMRQKIKSLGNPSKTQSALASGKIGAKNLGIGAAQLSMMAPPQLGLYGAEDEARWYEQNAMPAKESLGRMGQANEAEFAQHMQANPWTSMISRGLTEGALTGPLAVEKAGVQAAGYLPRVMQSLGRGAREGARGGAAIGGLGYTPENESRGLNALTGAGVGAGAGASLSGAATALNPRNMIQGIRGNATDEQLINNLRAAEGTETSLGRVTENSWLRDLSENALAYIPGSGARGAQKRTTQEIEKKAEKVLDILGGGKKRENVDLNELIQKELQTTAKGKRQMSAENYKKMNELADTLGLEFDTQNIQRTASQILKEIDKSPSLARRAHQKNPDLMNDLKFYSKKNAKEPKPYSIEDFISGKVREELPEAKKETLESLGILRGELGEDSWNKLMQGERNASGKYAQLKEAANRDIAKTIEGSGNEELGMLGQKANQYYKENIVPLEHPRLKKYINDTGRTRSEEIVPEFIRQGRIDRPKRAEQLIGNLGEEGQQALRQSYFGGPRLEGGAKNIQNQYNKIGPKTLETLVPEQAMRQQVGDLANLARMNPEGFIDMFNPKTGARAMFVEGAKMLAGGATSFAAPFLVPLAWGVNKALTSPKVRDAVVKELTKSGKKSETEIMRRLGEALRYSGESVKATSRGTSASINSKKEPVTVETMGEY